MKDRQDILVEIPDEDLPKLAEMYKETTSTPWAFSMVETFMRWKKQCGKSRKLVTITSPNGCWKTDGTIVVFMDFACYDVFVFTLDKKCENLYEGLVKTKRIDFSRKFQFFNIHSDHVPTVMKFIAQGDFEVVHDYPCKSYAMPIQKALDLNVECPPEVYIKKLDVSFAKTVNHHWPHKTDITEGYMATILEMNGGFGVFLKSTDELVAWSLVHVYGHIGILTTVEEHKQKGYASLITKAVCQDIVKRGHVPYASVMDINTPSNNMFKKIGFNCIGDCSFIMVQKKA